LHIAAKLRDMADVLEQQEASPFRVSAYRRAAATIEALRENVEAVLAREGREGLKALPGVGEAIASAIAEMCASGRWSQLDRLTGALEPEKLFRIIPGIGPELAERLHEELGVDTLEQLEIAAHDGRLEAVAGLGPRRALAIRAFLADRLGRRRLRRGAVGERPSVGTLLAVDAAYRTKASAGSLRRIAPRRFNPSGTAWLAIMHESRGKWRVTALYSNTATAHALGKTGDWVVIYYQADGAPEGQCTIVTETQGPCRNRRVVRGRERECEAFYATKPSQPRLRGSDANHARAAAARSERKRR
jgi:predicted flap endonuclease-1-like 5' DNA nuclease